MRILPVAENMFRKFEKITIRWIALFTFRTANLRVVMPENRLTVALLTQGGRQGL